VRTVMVAWLALALLLVGLSVGRAAEIPRSDTGREATATVQVKSADHELAEGYFSLGDSTTIVAKPGSELYRFLRRQRGQKITIVLREADTRELSQLTR
jgi:hypothetical protein